MKRFLIGAALAVAALTFATTAQAAGPRGKSGGRNGNNHPGGHDMHNGQGNREGYREHKGTKFSYGHYFYGRNHNQWTYRYHWSYYGCDCYWCPDTSCWYYWCEPRNSYLPVSCISFAPPTPAAPVAAAAAAAASSSSTVAPTVVGPTIVTNSFGNSQPSTQPGPPSDLPPIVQPGPSASNTAIGTVGTVQPIGSTGLPPAPPRP